MEPYTPLGEYAKNRQLIACKGRPLCAHLHQNKSNITLLVCCHEQADVDSVMLSANANNPACIEMC